MRRFSLMGHQKQNDGHSTNGQRSSTTCTVAASNSNTMLPPVTSAGRLLHQTSKGINTSVIYKDATMDQRMVTQLMDC